MRTTALEDITIGLFRKEDFHQYMLYFREEDGHEPVSAHPELATALRATTRFHKWANHQLGQSPTSTMLINMLEPGGIIQAHTDQAVPTAVYSVLGEATLRIREPSDDTIWEFSTAPGSYATLANPVEYEQRAAHSVHNDSPDLRLSVVFFKPQS